VAASGRAAWAILLAEFDAGDGALFLEEVFEDGGACGLSGKSGEGTEPDDAEIVAGIAADLFGGQGCGAGEEFGLGLRAYVMMDRSLGAGEERGGQGFVALLRKRGEGEADVVGGIELDLTDGVPEGSPQ
jgi:hypothetical protein